MSNFQSFSKKDLETIKYHFEKIYEVCGNEFEPGCGSYLFDGKDYKMLDDVHQKQILLFNKVKGKSNILEIGTYMGHSLLIMLVSNPNINITTIDLDDRYASPAIHYLTSNFPKAKIEFIHNNSISAIKKLKPQYDFFHIDGAHKNKVITEEFNLIKKLSRSDLLEIIFDDDITCKNLIRNITTTFKVEEKVSKGQHWYTNLYLKIKLPKSWLQKLKLNFIFLIKNYMQYLYLKLKKLIRLKKI
tara:strand:- start:143 stop:874 length:732 start_codon:yes stop_codon:yes gene_type:complete